MNRALTITTGQTHVQRYMRPLLERVQNGEIDPASSPHIACGWWMHLRATRRSATSGTTASKSCSNPERYDAAQWTDIPGAARSQAVSDAPRQARGILHGRSRCETLVCVTDIPRENV